MLSEPKPNPHQDPLRAYVESVLHEARFGDLSPEMRADVTAALMNEAERRVGLELLKASDERTLADFERLADHGAGNEELAAFFSVRIPDMRERVKAVLASFAEECVREAETFKKGNG